MTPERPLLRALKPAAHQPAAPAWGDAERIAEVMSEGGCWVTCSGCYETEDGQNVHGYPHSRVFGVTQGSGCSECGGLGVVWDNTDYSTIGLALPPPAPTLDLKTVARVIEEHVLAEPIYSPGEGVEWTVTGAKEAARTIIAMAPPADASQSAEVERVEWRPMKDAPKPSADDASIPAERILLLFRDGNRSVGYWDWYYAPDGNGFETGLDAWIEPCSGERLSLHFDGSSPIAWQPLPTPPAAETEGG